VKKDLLLTLLQVKTHEEIQIGKRMNLESCLGKKRMGERKEQINNFLQAFSKSSRTFAVVEFIEDAPKK
jgi:hypothetical protein